MRRLVATAAAAAVVLGAAGAQATTLGRHMVRAASTASTAGWVSTGTSGLSLAKVGDLGEVAATTPMHVAVSLAIRNASSERAALAAIYSPSSASYHHFLTPAQFTAAFSPTPATAQAVASYLAANGFSSVTISPNRLLVTANGTTSSVESAFATNIHAFSLNGSLRYANVSAALLPAQFSGVVTGVLGLNNVPQQTHHVFGNAAVQNALAARSIASKSVKFPQAQSSFSCTGIGAGPVCSGMALTPNQLRVAYHDEGSPLGSNTNVGVFTFGGLDGVVNDLRIMEYRQGLRQVPVSILNINGPQTAGAADAEWDLDTQSSTGVAGDVKSLTIFNSSDGSDEGTTVMYNTWVSQDNVQATSASYGECEEFAYEDGSMHSDDQIFFEGAMQGQSIFASTGDTGSQCYFPLIPYPTSPNGTPLGQPGVSYPSSSPFVVAVGGTDLLVNSADGSYNTETGWQTGGGGMSIFEISFEYQTTPYDALNRQVPDIAMTADPNVGDAMDVIVQGADEGVGGTSLSSPLSMGVYSRLLSHHNNSFGNALETFYASYANWGGYGSVSGQETFVPPTPGTTYTQIVGFKDLLIGTNGLYDCLPGYDMVTGLGSLDISGQITGWGS